MLIFAFGIIQLLPCWSVIAAPEELIEFIKPRAISVIASKLTHSYEVEKSLHPI